MRMDLNIQSLINISRKRLCNCADITTQKMWLMVIKEIAKIDPIIAWACVPEGIRTFGCPEKFGECHKCEMMLSDISNEDKFDLIKRYDKYNEFVGRTK